MALDCAMRRGRYELPAHSVNFVEGVIKTKRKHEKFKSRFVELDGTSLGSPVPCRNVLPPPCVVQ